MINPQLAVAGTVNKDGGTPVSSDDRVVLITPGDVRWRQRQGLTRPDQTTAPTALSHA